MGLPLTSGPVSLFLALERGPHFAGEAASGSIAGVLAAVVFVAAYTATARRGWPVALATGTASFALAAAAVRLLPVGSGIPLPLLPLCAAVVVGLMAGLWLVPSPARTEYAVAMPAWDLPLRAAVATAIVLLITAAAPLLGPQLSGFVTTYPVYAGVITVFAHRQIGPDAARQVLRGLLYGIFGFFSFFVVIAALIERWGIVPAFAIAVVAAVTTQALTLGAMRRSSPNALPT